MMSYRVWKVALAMVFCFTPVMGQGKGDRLSLPLPGFKAADSVPTSKSVLRYDWGEEISGHYHVERYLTAIATACPKRTKLVRYGSTSEGRSLNYLVISSEANMTRLEEIRKGNLELADPRVTSSKRAAELADAAPAIVWLAYCVHGNEISPSDAALLTAYHLLADERPETKQILDKLVVIIDPLQNPDGRDRFVNVFRETQGVFSQKNPYANEHVERWPLGRSNHYWFDMNRDWFRHSQREVAAKVKAYLHWQPQVYVDAHEMGRNSSYYFPPPADPKNPYLLESQHDWFAKLGKHQAGWFDQYGFGYMTREVFDAFYPGYGSEWPTLQGGLGVLWEQASARGKIVTRSDDTDLSYRNGVRNHYVSGLATLEFASGQRKRLLEHFFDTRSSAIRMGKEGDVKHYFLPLRHRPQRATQLATVLRGNGIDVRIVEQSLVVECSDVRNGKESKRKIPKGSFHLSVAQPASRLLRTLMDREVLIDKKFLRRQLERNQLRLPDEIYDVTAWSMPLGFDVDCFAVHDNIEIQSRLWDGKSAALLPALESARVAYLVPPTDGAIRVLSWLLRKNVRVHVNDESFTLKGRDFPRGTLIIKVAENDASLHAKVRDACRAEQVEAVATDTAYVDKGAHFGGPKVHWVRPPKVLLVVHRPTYYSSGHTWYLFDQVLRYPTT